MGLFGKEKPSAERPWDDPHDVAVITTQAVIDGALPVVLVTRDEGIEAGMGGWQFLDAAPPDQQKPVCLAKSDLLRLDSTLAEVTDLPIGWYAERAHKGGPWKREPMPAAEETHEADAETPLSPEADQFLAAACAEYDGKQEALERGEWRLASCSEWGFDDATGIVTVRFDDSSQWQADGQFLGSFNLDDQTFQWAWDSPDMGEHLTRDSRVVKEAGERFGLRYLLMGGGCFPIPGPEFVDYLCGIGVKATNSIGVMEAGAENFVGFILLKNPRWTHR